jgi:hypothetical protein
MPTANTERTAAKRVPISMSADEIGTLQQLAVHEQRSVAAMARIIYRAGLEYYKRPTKARAQR